MDYEYTKNYKALDALGCVAPKSKESIGSFIYNDATKCFDYPGTKCKLGNQCGAKGNIRNLKFICTHCYLRKKHEHIIHEWSFTIYIATHQYIVKKHEKY